MVFGLGVRVWSFGIIHIRDGYFLFEMFAVSFWYGCLVTSVLITIMFLSCDSFSPTISFCIQHSCINTKQVVSREVQKFASSQNHCHCWLTTNLSPYYLIFIFIPLMAVIICYQYRYNIPVGLRVKSVYFHKLLNMSICLKQ